MLTDFSCRKISINPSKIFLDVQNLRFATPLATYDWPDTDPKSQEIARRELMRRHGARSLQESILRLGFLPVDRVIVRNLSPDDYIVVEGNRRVAAIKTILHEARLGIISPSTKVLSSIEKIEVLNLTSKSGQLAPSALLLQGVRHISGVRNWGPFQQGRLVHALVESEGMNYSEIAHAVGLSPGRVSTLLRAYCGLSQMMRHPEHGSRVDTGLYSHFEHAYLKIPVRKWLGWDDDKKEFTNTAELEFFYSNILPVSSDSKPRLLARDIRDYLPDVLNNHKASESFINGTPIQDAYQLTGAQEELLKPFFDTALRLLNKNQNTKFKVNNNELQIIKKIQKFADDIIQNNDPR